MSEKIQGCLTSDLVHGDKTEAITSAACFETISLPRTISLPEQYHYQHQYCLQEIKMQKLRYIFGKWVIY